jgi:hypothetical protein
VAYSNYPPGPGGWAPPSPKPGVIPLRPLDLSEMLGGAFSTVGRYWKQLLGILLGVHAVAVLVMGAVVFLAFRAVAADLDALVELEGRDPVWADFRPLVVAFVIVACVGIVVMLATEALTASVCHTVLQDAVLGRRTSIGAVWGRAWVRVPSVLGTVALTGLMHLVPMGLFMTGYIALIVALVSQAGAAAALSAVILLAAVAAFPVAVWLGVRFMLAAPAAVFERQKAVAALRRSARLVRGDWWRVLGITLLATVITGAMTYAVQLPLNLLTMSSWMLNPPETTGDTLSELMAEISGTMALAMGAALLAQLLFSAFNRLVTGLLYVDQRIRKENLVPALAQASGAAGAPAGAPPYPGAYG